MPVEKVNSPIGLDLGTSTIKVSSDRFGKELKIPSLIGEPNTGGFDGMSIDKTWVNNLVITQDGQQYYVGELARLQSQIRRPLASEGKMKSVDNAILAIKAALSQVINGTAKQFVLATGVPVATSAQESKRLAQGLRGMHNIHVRNDATKEEKNIKAQIKRCLVLPEPYGTYYKMLKDSQEERAVDAVIVDIGHGSTDILCMYKGTMMRTASGSIEEATDTLTVRLAQAIQEKTGKIIKPFDLMKSLETGRKELLFSGEKWDISQALNASIKGIADVIFDETERLLSNLPPDAWIEKVIVTGGGAHLFGDQLQDLFWKRNIVKEPEEVLIPENPTMCNAQGFELIAQAKAAT